MEQTKIVKTKIGNFCIRSGTSDEKTLLEVIERDVYQKRGMKINPGETWFDLGANIGAFTVLAVKNGANVIAYEPDPNTFQILKTNVKLNNVKAELIQKAVVGDGKKKASLFISSTNQHWRNSIYKQWGDRAWEIDCVQFNDIAIENACFKIDNEGAEMAIIENMVNVGIKKVAVEWSFDIDPNIDRYRKAVVKLKTMFKNVKADSINEKHKVWLKSWFPAAKLIFAWND
jgi:FkbM family methyltransferase